MYAIRSYYVLMIVQIIAAVVLLVTAAGPVDSVAAMTDRLMERMMEWAWLMSILQTVIMIAVAVFTWKVIFKRRLVSMGLPRVGKHIKELLWGLLFGACAMTLVFALLLATGIIIVESWVPIASADTFLFIGIFILVGIAEETFSRGYCMSVMRQTRSIPLILIVPAVIFSLLHLSNPGFSVGAFVNITIVGLFVITSYSIHYTKLYEKEWAKNY